MKSYAKINVFLKIVGKTNSYHELISRFLRIDNLYDEVFIISKDLAKKLHKTNIYDVDFLENKTKNILNIKPYCDFCDDRIMDKYYQINDNFISNFNSKTSIFDKVLGLIPSDIKDIFIKDYAVFLHKNIPTFSGLGGASSNAATFIKLLKNIKDFDSDKIAALSGADVSFFHSGYKAANVSGYGEKIEEFIDDKLEFDIEFSQNCSTKEVFLEFAKNPIYYDKNDLLKLKSKEILKNYSNYFLNDLLKPCEQIYPKIKEYAKKGMYLSGSGGSFFSLKDEM